MTELSKAYNPKDVEARLSAWWESNGYYKPENQRHLDPALKPFVITIPPPNVTGTLHMGHALTLALEDLMTRYHRMKGARTLWVPGTDHAGIATQSVVEKKLAREGKRRQDMGRSAFIEEVWDWKEYSHEVITRQAKAMSISADWDREAFTMDAPRSRAVLTAFKTLYDRGLIYRATRMVNWDPVQLTGVSDLEAVTDDDGEAGHLWTLRYPLQTNRWDGPVHDWGSGHWADGATEWIQIATTRPETLLGDTAVMVHPDDERYVHRIACRAILPAIGREVPVIADASVDMAFGTGAVKVTPAHDFTDYEVGKRHYLPFVEVLDEHARMTDEAGPYAGLDRFECRKRIVADLQKEGLLVRVEDYRVRLARGERSGAVIEPRISRQWWCTMKDMAAAAAASVREGRIRLVPERFDKVWFHWLDNIRDWCISRQLWWGHQIPIWYVLGEDGKILDEMTRSDGQGRALQFCALSEADAYAEARKTWGDGVRLVQDSDVLDTWFSSGLWPFSTLGWPDLTQPDLQAWYPTTMLETGYDILFFWVARMVMMGLELTGKEPFDTVYLHGIIRQDDGKKMSKSRPEKAVDPLDMIEAYGADALRFYLVTAGAPGNDIKMEVKSEGGRKKVERIEGARNFANKLWNAARFALGRLEAAPSGEPAPSLADRWITARLDQTIAEVRRLSDDYQYGEAAKAIYEFVWSDFCDWYVELSKLALNAPVLVRTLESALRLLHPYMPHITEELWQALKATVHSRFDVPSFASPALILAPYPLANPITHDADLEAMGLVQSVIRAIRNVRAEHDVAPDKRIAAHLHAGARADLLASQRDAICALARVDPAGLVIATELPQPANAITIALGEVTAYVPLAGLVDVAAERERLAAELAALDAAIARIDALLASDFGARAPAAVVDKERARLSDARAKHAQVTQALAALSSH